MNYTVDIKGEQEVIKYLELIASNLKIGTEDILTRTATQVKSMMVDQAPVFTGKLKESIDITESSPGKRVIGVGVGYASAVEGGGGPYGFANVPDLKNRIFYGGKGGAWAFAKYLARTGKGYRDASWFIKKTADATQNLFESEIYNLIRRIL